MSYPRIHNTLTLAQWIQGLQGVQNLVSSAQELFNTAYRDYENRMRFAEDVGSDSAEIEDAVIQASVICEQAKALMADAGAHMTAMSDKIFQPWLCAGVPNIVQGFYYDNSGGGGANGRITLLRDAEESQAVKTTDMDVGTILEAGDYISVLGSSVINRILHCVVAAAGDVAGNQVIEVVGLLVALPGKVIGGLDPDVDTTAIICKLKDTDLSSAPDLT